MPDGVFGLVLHLLPHNWPLCWTRLSHAGACAQRAADNARVLQH